jgi:hypothetical protein
MLSSRGDALDWGDSAPSLPIDKRISSSSSSYISPLTAIHHAIRRQNPVAAAAAATLGRDMTTDNGRPVMDSDSSSDPWDYYGRSVPSAGFCGCRWMRDMSMGLCSTCGKRRRPYVVKEELEPQHALALLQSTPQLRVLCPASTDMQASGHARNRNLLQRLVPAIVLAEGNSNPSSATTPHKSNHLLAEYKASLLRSQSNQQAAAELASLLWVLAHEMSLEDYGAVESQVFTSVFGLVHATNDSRMAGLAALDALLAAPSADEEKKAIKFANTLSTGLRAAHGDYEFLSAVSKALGHMASRTANVDLVESEVTRALEWLSTERSDRRCVCLCFVLSKCVLCLFLAHIILFFYNSCFFYFVY